MPLRVSVTLFSPLSFLVWTEVLSSEEVAKSQAWETVGEVVLKEVVFLVLSSEEKGHF